MTYDEFMAKALEAFPDADVDMDEDGQLIISTGLKVENTEGNSLTWRVVSFMEET